MSMKRWEKMSVAELEAEVRRHNRLYFVKHTPEIPDMEFDRLVEILRSKAPDSQALTEIVSDVRPAGVKVRHAAPMLSLDKCYDDEALMDWASKFAGDVIASPKIDGVAVSIRYDKSGAIVLAATRGDGVEGERITENVKQIKSVPGEAKGLARLGDEDGAEVRGEIYMPLSIFKRYEAEFANPRNLAAGAVKQKDPKKTGDYSLSFFAYDLRGTKIKTEHEKLAALAKEGFTTIEWRRVSREEMQKAFDHFQGKRASYDFETDGVVFKADCVDEQERLGDTAHHPRFAIAYKFQGDSGVTTLTEVEWSVSRTGAITPVAIVEPVELSGAMVSRASMHNLGIVREFIENGLGIGAQVVMMRRGGVIPHVEKVEKPGKGTIEIPPKCPSCGAAVREEDDFLYCTNAKSCVRAKIAELEHFVKAVGIDGFGEKLLEKLYESGEVTEPADFYELKVGDLLEFERMGKTLAAKLVSNVQARSRIPLGVFLEGLGIRELGRHAAKILEGFGSLDKVLSLTEEELSQVKTIGPVIAREVVEGLKARRKLIRKLLKHVVVTADERPKTAGLLDGKNFLFTGKLLAMERSEAQKLVEGHGGVAAESMTKEIDYLVVGDGGGAGSKLAKAKKLQGKGGRVQIIGEKEFMRMIRS
ncbi:MAG: NAD-dependent DNA ligase LigA [bacterium]